MIEKIMKAVKSNNKKRGRNITIGAVVGLLLSCTAVMGKEVGLNITQGAGGEILFDGKEYDRTTHEYVDNTFDGAIYTNNTTITGTNPSGIKISLTDKTISILNNGSISGGGCGIDNYSGTIDAIENRGIVSGNLSFTSNAYVNNINGYGIYNYSGTIENRGIISENVSFSGDAYGDAYGYGINAPSGTIKNRGIISGNVSFSNGISATKQGSGSGSGIYIYSDTIENRGIISGTGVISGDVSGYGKGNGYGITTYLGTIKNRGIISGTGGFRGNVSSFGIGSGSGIVYDLGGVYPPTGTIENRGIISGTGVYSGSGPVSVSGYGIDSSLGKIKNLLNTGVIYGTTNAINNKNGTIATANNYGILVNGKNNDVTNNLTVVNNGGASGENKISNYGLIIKNGNVFTKGDNKELDVIVAYDDANKPLTRRMNIVNESVTGGDRENYILNALTDTYKANDKSEIKNSIINAHKTAVLFDGATEKELTLSGTIVNGGTDGTSSTIVGREGNNTLILQSRADVVIDGHSIPQDTIINGNIDMGAGNDYIDVKEKTVINGDIYMGAGDDSLYITSGSFVNGRLNGGAKPSSTPTTFSSDNDTLVFGKGSSSDEINILHNISGFENININADVTLFETTIGADGSSADLTVTGVDNITIGAGGVLTLRLNNNRHALTGNSGAISSTDGGKLLLNLNGITDGRVISFGGLKLDSSLVIGENGTLWTTSKIFKIEAGDNENEIRVAALWEIPEFLEYKGINKIYQSTVTAGVSGSFNVNDDEELSKLLGYLTDIYAGNPYSYSSELSRKSMGMFRDIVTENQFKANRGKWLIHGGLTHIDGGTKDTYFGKNCYDGLDAGSTDIDADTKITGAYMLGEYGVSDTLTSGVVIGGNKLKSDLSNGSKVEGNAMYLGAYAKKYLGNLKVTAGLGFQYGDYDADRLAVNNIASEIGTPVMKYSDNYNDMTYDIYLNGRYSHNIGENLFLEPYGTLSYTYIKQDGADEGSKVLAIETDSKSFDYTTAKVGVDLKKVVLHEKGKSSVSAGVSYTRILDGADEEFITGRFKGGSDFDILVAHKNEHSIGLNAKYSLELENGILFDVKGTYAVERDSHNQSGKNKAKGEWIVGAGLGYKF